MITKRSSEERGRTKIDWLDSRHSFSFGGYFDPENMGFRTLRVINEDWIHPASGFGPHPHQDMEIITYVLEGSIEHQDDMGNRSQLQAGRVQKMTAGTGVVHAEYNASKKDTLHLLQIWIEPEKPGLEPGYEELPFPREPGKLTLIASRDARENSLRLNQDAALHAALLDKGQTVSLDLAPGRHAWVQVARGAVSVNGTDLNQGDAATLTDEKSLRVTAAESSEILVFDLA